MEQPVLTPAVFGGSLLRTFEYHTVGVPQAPEVRWTFTASARISCPLLVDQGVIYVGDTRGYFSAIEASSGDLLWSFATNVVEEHAEENNPSNGVRAACLDGARGYIATETMLYELDLRKGQAIHSWPIYDDEERYYDDDGEYLGVGMLFCGGKDSSSLDVSDDLLICSIDGEHQRILRRSIGERQEEGYPYTSDSIPTISHGNIYQFVFVNNNDNEFLARKLALEDEDLWAYSDVRDYPDPDWKVGLYETLTLPILDGTLFGIGMIHNNDAGLGGEDGLVALDPMTGHIKWYSLFSPYISDREFRCLAAAQGLVFIGTDRGTEAVDIQTHYRRWTREVETGTRHLFVVDSLLYVIDDDGDMTALDVQTGEPQWNWQIPDEAHPEQAHVATSAHFPEQAHFTTIANGTLYLVKEDVLYALSSD